MTSIFGDNCPHLGVLSVQLDVTLVAQLGRLGKMLQCTGAPEIAEPGFALRSGMIGTMIYWLSVNVLGLLTPREGAALIVTIFVAHVSHPQKYESAPFLSFVFTR